jgi:hypothetical protein
VPYVTDGRSLLQATGRKRILIEQWFGVPDWAANWRPGSLYLEFVGRRAREFYDFVHDPAELRNRFGNRKTGDDPSNARTLSRILRGDMTCAGATCP